MVAHEGTSSPPLRDRFERSLSASAPETFYIPPRQLYRFRSFSSLGHAADELRECLDRCRVYCSDPRKFNDKYDCAPVLVREQSRSVKLAIDELWVSRNVSIFTHERRLALDASFRFLQEDDFEAWLKTQAESMFRQAFQYFSCACFTENPQSSAMWYHYANKYSGVCFEFSLPEEMPDNIGAIIFSSSAHRFRPIEYQEMRPLIDPLTVYLAYVASGELSLQLRYQEEIQDTIRKGYFVKSQDWNYEREVRLLARGRHTYRPIYPYFVSAVILGPSSSSDLSTLVEDWARASAIPLHRASLADDRYGIHW